MDKGIGTIYHKLTNLFHPNPSTTAPTNNISSTPEMSGSLPISTFFDRLIPSSTTQTKILHNPNRYHNTSRVTRQISIKTDQNCVSSQPISFDTQNTTPLNILKQSM
jgi:hypothetical protein